MTKPTTRSRSSSSSPKIPFPSKKITKVISQSKTLTLKPLEPSNSSQTLTASIPLILKPLSSNGEIDLALRHLRASDSLLASLIESHRPPAFDSSASPFVALSRSILYQQLATNAAKTIYTRFLSLCGGEDTLCPEALLRLSVEQLREVGVSGRKASYLHDLAEKFKSGFLSDSSVIKMDDEELVKTLTMVKGIGVWSVHMFMIFSLHRPDVLPVGDLGVRKGVQVLYGLKELPKPLQMEELCEKWKPYRSVGSWYMWRLMEAKNSMKAKNSILANANKD